MNSLGARDLLLNLKSQVSNTHYRRKKTIQHDILNLFTFNEIENKVSLKANALACNTKYNSRILNVFATAIRTLQSDSSFFRDKFYFDLRKEFKQANLLNEPSNQTAVVSYNAQLGQLEAKMTENVQRIESDLVAQSPLHRLPAQTLPKLNGDDFQRIFQDQWLDNPNHFNYFMTFLRQHPEYASANLEDAPNMMAVLQCDKAIFKEFFGGNKLLPPEDRQKKMQQLSEQMAQSMSYMCPGEKRFFAGSFGTEVHSLGSLGIMLQKLPALITHNWPKALRDLLQTPNPDPFAFLAKLIETNLERFIETLPTLNNQPEALTQLMHFLSQGPQQAYLQSLGMDLAQAGTPEQRRELVMHYKGQLMQHVQQVMENPKAAINAMLQGYGSTLQEMIPNELLYLTGLDAFISSGPVWFEFERKRNGTIDLTVYGGGVALQEYPNESLDGKIKWPMKFLDVNPHDFDATFFERLLFHHIEPNVDANAVSTASDLYDNILASIKKYNKPIEHDDNWRKVGTDVNNTDRLLQTMLLNTTTNREEVLFETRYQALLDYCRPYIYANGLKGFDESAEHCLSLAVQALEGQHSKLKISFSAAKNSEVQLVFDEINHFLLQHKNNKLTNKPEKPVLPESILRSIQEKALQIGLTAETVEYIQKMLCQSLGQRVEPMTDYIAQILQEALALPQVGGQQLATQASEPVDDLIGNLRQSFNTMGATIASTLGVLSANFGQFIPEHIQEQLRTAQNMFNQNSFEFLFSAFLNSQLAAQIKAGIAPSLKGVERIGNSLNYVEHVEFDAKPLTTNQAKPFTATPAAFKLQKPNDNGKAFGLGAEVIASRQPVNNERELLTEIEGLACHDRLEPSQAAYALHAILSWDFPDPMQDTYWTSLQDPDECLKHLAKLNDLLSQARNPLDSGKALDIHILAAQYKMITIMHYIVVHVLKQEACNHPLNIIPMIREIKYNFSLMAYPEVNSQLQKIISYHFPKMNIEALPDDKELEELEKNCLFFVTFPTLGEIYHKQGRWKWLKLPFLPFIVISEFLRAFTNRKPEVDLNTHKLKQHEIHEKEYFKRHEFTYLNQLLKDPDILQKLQHYPDEHSKLKRLVLESFVINSEIVPAYFALLKTQTVNTTHKINSTRTGSIDDHFRARGFLDRLAQAPYFLYMPPGVDKIITRGADKGQIDTIQCYTTPPKNQSEIIAGNAEFKDTYKGITFESYHLFLHQLPPVVFSEMEDSLLRSIDDFKNNVEKYKFRTISGHLMWLRYLLFKPGFLKDILTQSPHHAAILSEFINGSFHYLLKNKKKSPSLILDVVSMATDVQRIARDINQEHLFTSLNFLPYYEEIALTAQIKTISVFNEFYDLHFDSLSLEERKKFFITLFIMTNHESKSGLDVQLLSKWIDDIKVMAVKDAQFRQQLVLTMLATDGRPVDATVYQNWTIVDADDLVFECNGLVVNLLNMEDTGNSLIPINMLVNEGWFDRSMINDEKLFYESTSVLRTRETPSGHYKITLLEPDQNQDKRAKFRWHKEGKVYSYFLKEVISPQLLEMGVPITDDIKHCWIEENEGLFKQVILIGKEAKTETYILKRESVDSSDYYLHSIMVDGRAKLKYNLSKADHSMYSLKGFCKESEIICTTDEESNRFEAIEFKPYQLTFQIEEKEGATCAVNKQLFPSFKIAQEQFHSSFEGISSYLVLDSEFHQKKKVLVPDGQLPSAAAWRITESYGAANNLLKEYALNINQAMMEGVNQALGMEQNKYYVFDVDDKGRIVSDNQEAMAYLVLLYIAQGDNKKALATCKELEKLLRRQPYSEKAAQKISLLALMPVNNESVRFMRMRLFSALEESRLVHKKAEEPQKQQRNAQSINKPLLILSAVVVANDLKAYLELAPENRNLTTSQEYFLFQKILEVGKDLLGKSAPPKMKITFLGMNVKKWLPFLTEAFCLPKSLVERYQEIKQQYQMQGSYVIPALQYAKRLFNREMPFNPYYYIYRAGQLLPSNVAQKDTSDSQLVLNLLRSLFSYLIGGLAFALAPPPQSSRDSAPQVVQKPEPAELLHLTAKNVKEHFADYYAMARGDKGPEFKAALAEELRRVKGGWDHQSKFYVNLLYHVAKTNRVFIFPKTDQLDFKFEVLCMAVCFLDNWEKIFTIHSRVLSIPYLMAEGMLKVMSASAYAGSYASVFFVDGIEYVKRQAARGVSYVKESYHHTNAYLREVLGLAQAQPVAIPNGAKPQAFAIRYAEIRQDDAQMDKFLKDVFDQLFVEEIAPASWHTTPMKGVLKVKEDQEQDQVLKGQVKRVNGSIDDYYDRPDRVPNLLRYKDSAQLWQAYLQLEMYRDQIKSTLENDKRMLLECLNAQSSLKEPITLDQLYNALLKEDFAQIAVGCHLAQDELDKIIAITIRNAARETRLQQLERNLNLLEDALKLDENAQKEAFEDKLESLADGLQARRTYLCEGQEVPSRLFVRFLMIELRKNRMLWMSQIKAIVGLLPKEMQNAVLELIMGLGKTTNIIPIETSLEVDGSKAVFNNYPKQTAVNNIAELSDVEMEVFDLVVNGLLFSREIPLSKRDLNALSVVL